MKRMSAIAASSGSPSGGTVPFLDFSREFAEIRDEVLAVIEQVCSDHHYILGPPAERFEAEAARFCQVDSALGCASGTDALWLAMAALGIGPGQAVLTTPFSFFATVSSIVRAGAHPVLADIDERTFNLSPQSASEALQRPLPDGLRAAAIMPVHLYGQCADMDALATLASEHNLAIVEDAAQAFGALWHQKPAGSLGDTAAFSFYPTKNLAAFGDAGMVTARDASVTERVRALRNHGMRRRYYHEEFDGHLGWNSRLDGIQAAVLSLKLKRLPAANGRRREIAALYRQLFKNSGLGAPEGVMDVRQGVVLPFTDPRATPIFHQFVIRAPQRDDLRGFLTARGIGSEIYYPLPLHLQESLAYLGYKSGDFPQAERAAAEVLALPIYPELHNDEIATVVEAIRSFYN